LWRTFGSAAGLRGRALGPPSRRVETLSSISSTREHIVDALAHIVDAREHITKARSGRDACGLLS
jgi:hypothetical protein